MKTNPKRTHRHRRRQLFVALLPAVLIFFSYSTQAEIFKCVAENGEITFSQTPCPREEKEVKIHTSARGTSEPADCEHARRFALHTAQEMKAGASSTTVFDRYGGLGALSKGSVGLISYVYEFRTNDDVSVERVSALAVAKCQARALGDVSCEKLPTPFTNSLGGCDKEGETEEDAEIAFARETPQPVKDDRDKPELNAALRKQQRQASAYEEEQQLQCKKNIRSQINSINSQMRSGYSSSTGDSLRKKRRDLENRLRDC